MITLLLVRDNRTTSQYLTDYQRHSSRLYYWDNITGKNIQTLNM